MEEEADFQVGGGQIAEELARRVFLQSLGRFVLDQKLLVDEHVHSLPGERLAAEVDHHADFAFDAVALRAEGALHGQRINVFAESESELVEDFVGRADDGLGELFFEQFAARLGGHARVFVGSRRAAVCIRCGAYRVRAVGRLNTLNP